MKRDLGQAAMVATLLGMVEGITVFTGSQVRTYKPAPVPRKEQKLRLELAEQKRQRRASKLLKQLK
jgi:hypothetical protein